MYTEKILERIVTKAPGRTCLFGDHQDYLGLPVIACAINRCIDLKAKKNNGMELIINKPDIGEKRTIDLKNSTYTVKKGDHLLAAIAVLKEYGCIPSHGYDIEISGNVAINAGTSSSSAVVLAWIQFLVVAYGCNHPLTKEFLSKIAHRAEVTFHGAPGGKMDQYSIGMGNIMYMQTDDSNAMELFKGKIPGLIVAESGIPKDTTGVLGELKERALLAIHSIKRNLTGFDIRKVNKAELPKFRNYVDDNLKIYLDAAVLNHHITKQALLEFRKAEWNFQRIGDLMNQHHDVLKNYLNITVPPIDDMIDGALTAGALGAKIVGSGRGGSIVVLAREGEQNKVIDALKNSGAKDAYMVQVDPGARIIQSK
ncbi:mevalonate kinase [Flagellimonas pacifica]|uniref:Mevalonate kinase n=1 Tax=Flagellimonas pacifica TaxID=1247520 RepID=A0A285MQQ1_9FLAO|nr:galactokinase family protein [Allomuricauda parva]SNY99509.1 mevalonate kinase [Allomuricauda parva]